MSSSFSASLRAMLDEARDGVARAQAEGLAKVREAVGRFDEAKAATQQVAQRTVNQIDDEVSSILADIGQISNMPPS